MNLSKVKTYKIADKGNKPMPALSTDQFPTEVEDPITGEMVSLDKGSKKVKDSVDERTQKEFYNYVLQFLKRNLKTLYPTCKDTPEDIAGNIYLQEITPVTQEEDIKKLKETDKLRGVVHDEDWYKHKQTIYPKVAPLEKFDASKSSIAQYANVVAKQRLTKIKNKDPEKIRKNKEGEGFSRQYKTMSLDDIRYDAEGDGGYSEAERLINEQYPQDEIDTDSKGKEYIDKLSRDERREAVEKLKERLVGEPDRKTRETLKTWIAYAEASLAAYGRGNYAKSKNIEIGGKDDYPFGIEPQVVWTNTHKKLLKFTFESKKEAQEKTEEFEDVMRDKGWVLNNVRGTSATYKRED